MFYVLCSMFYVLCSMFYVLCSVWSLALLVLSVFYDIYHNNRHNYTAYTHQRRLYILWLVLSVFYVCSIYMTYELTAPIPHPPLSHSPTLPLSHSPTSYTSYTIHLLCHTPPMPYAICHTPPTPPRTIEIRDAADIDEAVQAELHTHHTHMHTGAGTRCCYM
jgi:hypothetical protein